jgi:hypothetical protein
VGVGIRGIIATVDMTQAIPAMIEVAGIRDRIGIVTTTQVMIAM